MDHSPEPQQPDKTPPPRPPLPPPGFLQTSHGISPGTPSYPSPYPTPPYPPLAAPPRSPLQVAGGPPPIEPIIPEEHWLPRGGIRGTTLALRDLLESYGWLTWWGEMRKASQTRDVSDLAGPMSVFGMRLRQRTPNTMARDIIILLLILASPFVMEAAMLTALEFVKANEELQDMVYPTATPSTSPSTPAPSPLPALSPTGAPRKPVPGSTGARAPGFGYGQLLSIVNAARPFYSAAPFLLALAIIAIRTYSHCRVPFMEHAHELNRMTRMQSLNIIYSCWGYYIANMLPGLSLLLPAVLARHVLWNTNLKSELAILCVFSGVLLLFSGRPITVIPDASAKDENGKPRKASRNVGCNPISFGILFMFGLPMLGPGIFLLSYIPRLPLLPLISGCFLLLPWIVMYKLLNTAEPWRYHTENYTLPRRLITWGTLISGAVAGVLCAWPAWLTMLPGIIMVALGYLRSAPKILEDVAPASHFTPFQTHGRLWQLLGRLGYPGWQSIQLFTIASFILYVSLGVAVDAINSLSGSNPWMAFGSYSGPGTVFITLAIIILWNTLMYPLAIIRFITPRDGVYGMSIITIHFITLLTFLILAIVAALIHMHVTPISPPPFMHILPVPGAIMSAFYGTAPEPLYLGLATLLLTFLAGLHLYKNMDWMQLKERDGRKLRSTKGSNMLA
ncbi:MAG TPA: hypothetical protein VK970_19585 [Candidatus Methylacidiphilales bacterium]|nr:hypothetical protein [Candidatus Methylacidiphilales bacterium]